MAKEVRDGLLIFLGTLALGAVLFGFLGVVVLGLEEYLARRARIAAGCESNDARHLRQCGDDNQGLAR